MLDCITLLGSLHGRYQSHLHFVDEKTETQQTRSAGKGHTDFWFQHHFKPLCQWLSECGPGQQHQLHLETCEKCNFWALLQTYWSRTSGLGASHRCFRNLWSMLKFEDHWIIQKHLPGLCFLLCSVYSEVTLRVFRIYKVPVTLEVKHSWLSGRALNYTSWEAIHVFLGTQLPSLCKLQLSHLENEDSNSACRAS